MSIIEELRKNNKEHLEKTLQRLQDDKNRAREAKRLRDLQRLEEAQKALPKALKKFYEEAKKASLDGHSCCSIMNAGVGFPSAQLEALDHLPRLVAEALKEQGFDLFLKKGRGAHCGLWASWATGSAKIIGTL